MPRRATIPPQAPVASSACRTGFWSRVPEIIRKRGVQISPGRIRRLTRTRLLGGTLTRFTTRGGLLDANVAGYPSIARTGMVGSTNPAITDQTLYKTSLGYADLTQLQDASGATILTQAQVDQLAGWRNNASTQASGTLGSYTFSSVAAPALNPAATGFFDWATQNSGRFLTTASTSNPGINANSGGTNHPFVSRQQLIQFVLYGLGKGTPTMSLQSALQCLGTFRPHTQPAIHLA